MRNICTQIELALAQSEVPAQWYQESEIITLLLGLTGILVARRLFDFTSRSAAHALMAGFWAIIAAYVFTILEGFVWQQAFNVAEHLAYAASACLFAVGVRLMVADRRAELTSRQVDHHDRIS